MPTTPSRRHSCAGSTVEQYWPTLTSEPGGVDYLEVGVAGLPALWAVPKGSSEDRVILGAHAAHRMPRRSHPAPLDDTVAAYWWLLDQGVAAEHVAVVGDSIGSGLSVLTLLRVHDLGLPSPAALMLMSPWVDLTVSNRTFETNRDTEEFFHQDLVAGLASRYLAGTDPKDPLASPLYADLGVLPPTFIQTGGGETLLGESLELDENARKAGVDVRLEVFPGQLHLPGGGGLFP